MMNILLSVGAVVIYLLLVLILGNWLVPLIIILSLFFLLLIIYFIAKQIDKSKLKKTRRSYTKEKDESKPIEKLGGFTRGTIPEEGQLGERDRNFEKREFKSPTIPNISGPRTSEQLNPIISPDAGRETDRRREQMERVGERDREHKKRDKPDRDGDDQEEDFEFKPI